MEGLLSLHAPFTLSNLELPSVTNTAHSGDIHSESLCGVLAKQCLGGWVCPRVTFTRVGVAVRWALQDAIVFCGEDRFAGRKWLLDRFRWIISTMGTNNHQILVVTTLMIGLSRMGVTATYLVVTTT